MEEFRNSLIDHYTGEKLKITPLAFIMKALVVALKKFPTFNSSIEDMSTGKNYFQKILSYWNSSRHSQWVDGS